MNSATSAPGGLDPSVGSCAETRCWGQLVFTASVVLIHRGGAQSRAGEGEQVEAEAHSPIHTSPIRTSPIHHTKFESDYAVRFRLATAGRSTREPQSRMPCVTRRIAHYPSAQTASLTAAGTGTPGLCAVAASWLAPSLRPPASATRQAKLPHSSWGKMHRTVGGGRGSACLVGPGPGVLSGHEGFAWGFILLD